MLLSPSIPGNERRGDSTSWKKTPKPNKSHQGINRIQVNSDLCRKGSLLARGLVVQIFVPLFAPEQRQVTAAGSGLLTAVRSTTMAEQQFPDWIEKYRATIPQPQQEKTSRFDWWWIGSLVLTLTFVAGLVHILWITYRTRP